MIYTEEEKERFNQVSRIIIKLLSKGEITDRDDRDLIIAYDTDEEIREMISLFADEARLEIFDREYGYLAVFQKDTRAPFTLKREDFYKRTGLDSKRWPVFAFFTFAIFSLFFDEEGNESVNLKRIVEFCDEKAEKIKASLSEEDVNAKYNWNFSGLITYWDSLRETTNIETTWDSSRAVTKQGILVKTIKFLQEERLLEFAPEFQTISRNAKTEGVLYALMKDERFRKIVSLMRGEEDAGN